MQNDYINNILLYFKEFLETGFRRGRTPKRRIIKYLKKTSICLNTEEYYHLKTMCLDYIKDFFNERDLIIEPQKHPSINKKSEEILENIKNYIFPDTILKEIILDIENNDTKDNVVEKIENTLLLGFLLNIGVEESNIEEKSSIYKVIYDFIKISIDNDEIINSEDIKNEIYEFFLQDTRDAHSSLINIINSKYSLFTDKSKFYLYFFSINFENNTYPLFFIPLEETYNEKIKFEDLGKIYINKKAITYIFKKFGQDATFLENRLFQENWDEPMAMFNHLLIKLGQEKISDLMNDYNNSFYYENQKIIIKSSIHIQLFEDSDEAIVNDYEKLLDSDSILKDDIVDLIGNYLNPKEKIDCIKIINNEWEEQTIKDKLIAKSPINLSPEQKQILMALNKKNCQSVLVQGPPGTGKSHTIISIVFDYILNNKSVLILSDKNEALDVVDHKINDSLKNNRKNKDIISPILRLGVKKNNLHNITKRSHVELLKNEIKHYKGSNNYVYGKFDELQLTNARTSTENNYEQFKEFNLKRKQRIELIEKIKINSEELEKIEKIYERSTKNLNESDSKFLKEKEKLESIENRIKQEKENYDSYTKEFNNKDKTEHIKQYENIKQEIEKFISITKNVVNGVKNNNKNICYNDLKAIINIIGSSREIGDFPYHDLSDKDIDGLDDFYEFITNLSFLDKYIFERKEFRSRGAKIKLKFQDSEIIKEKNLLKMISKLKKAQRSVLNINTQYDTNFKFEDLSYILDFEISDDNVNLIKNNDIRKKITSFNDNYFNDNVDIENISDINSFNSRITEEIKKTQTIQNENNKAFNHYKEEFEHNLEEYEKNYVKQKSYILQFQETFNSDKIENNNAEINFKKLKEHLDELLNKSASLEANLRADKSCNYNFVETKNKVEDKMLSYLSDLLNKSSVAYYDNNKKINNIRVMQKAVKQKMSIEQFKDLSNYFPCIIASLRDYAEIIPLSRNLIDLIIIDEASQVSIAQAFPALIRAKKVLILGDNKQFANVKSSNAGEKENKKYLDKILTNFKKDKSFQPDNIEKIKMFNIKSSIMDFFIDNNPDFEIMLKTHFRGYPELISYSNKNFYGNNLQALKIREKSKKEIIKFHKVEHSNMIGEYNNTNFDEIYYILNQLKKFKKENLKSSIGIITPHTQQVKCFWEIFSKDSDKEYFIENFNLKIMTFDSCQGEERDIIFYSMVANKKEDNLKYIFLKQLGDHSDDEIENSVRAQRLNVGFSRCKESMHFVISKEVDEYNGSIGEALMHFKSILEEEDQEYQGVDKKSPMENKIKSYIEQTPTFKANKDITLKCQFPIGDYLKQIDKDYNRPKYIVDFLISYNGRKVVVEYDGFEFHYEKNGACNFDLKDDDLYRQNILESYGYPFIRLNKFNIKSNDTENINYIDNQIKKNLVL